jgi:hypothetical protein
MGFGTARNDVLAAFSDCGHDLQLLANIVERSVFGKPAKGIHHSFFVRHGGRLLRDAL